MPASEQHRHADERRPAHLSRRVVGEAAERVLVARSARTRERRSRSTPATCRPCLSLPRDSWMDVTSRCSNSGMPVLDPAGQADDRRPLRPRPDEPEPAGDGEHGRPAMTVRMTRRKKGVSRNLSTRQSMNVQTATTASATVSQRARPQATWKSRSRPLRERSFERPIRGTC